jgi:hypothetical protein
VSDGLGIDRSKPDFVSLSIVVLFLEKSDLGVVTLRALFEVLGVVARPGLAEVGQVINQRLLAVPELHRPQELEQDRFTREADAGADAKVLIHNERDEGVELELLQVHGEDVDPEVLQEERGDQVGLELQIRQQLEPVVGFDGRFGSGRCRVGLLPLPTTFDHRRGRGETPRVVLVFEDAEVLGVTPCNFLVSLPSLLSGDRRSVRERSESHGTRSKRLKHRSLEKQR